MAERIPDAERREIQLDSLEILRVLDKICKENGLSYFITAGTLLGAVRHGGFIPWDDDVDVVMPRADFNKLRKIIKTALPNGYFYQSEKTEKEYPFLFAKIRKDGKEVFEPVLKGFKMHSGRYIDIFPLDKCPDRAGLARIMFKLVELFTVVLLSKGNRELECQYKKSYARFAFKLLRVFPRWLIRFKRRATVALCTLFSSGGKLCTVAGAHGYPAESYSREWFSSAVDMDFEGERFPAPSGWESLLVNMYGDYMTPPAEDDRAGHFEKNEKNDIDDTSEGD